MPQAMLTLAEVVDLEEFLLHKTKSDYKSAKQILGKMDSKLITL